jgi:hypothetical protein
VGSRAHPNQMSVAFSLADRMASTLPALCVC